MELSTYLNTFWQSSYWKAISSFIGIGTIAFLSLFCVSTYAWFTADGGNGIYWYDRYFVYIASFIITFIFSFIFLLLWIRVRIKFLFPFFVAIGILAFAIFSSLLNIERQEKLAILERYQSFRYVLNSGNWEAGYLFMSPEYREGHTEKEFEEDILSLIELTYDSKRSQVQEVNIHAIHPLSAKAWLAPFQSISKDFHPSAGISWNLVNVDGQWYFEEYPNFFID